MRFDSFMRTPALAALLLAPVAMAGEFFPLAPNNSWTYRNAQTGQEFTVRAGTPFLINGNTYYPLTGYTETKLMARVNESNVLVHYDEESGKEVQVTSFQPGDGMWWQANFRQCDQEGQTAEKRSEYRGAAGYFAEALDIRYRTFSCADTGVVSEKFVENIGMVQREVTTIAGPRKYELVRSRIGKQLLEADNLGRFTLAIAELPEIFRATLRVEAGNGAPLRLLFPTAQEYEVVVRHPNGKELWRWSEGRMFAQVERMRVISGEWSATVDIPRTVVPPDADVLYVEAWMTTAPDTPRFAATVPISLPQPAQE